MKKCKWHICPPPTEQEQKELIQVYEFIRIPYSEVREVRIFFDMGQEEFLRSRKFISGNVEWWKTSPHYAVVDV